MTAVAPGITREKIAAVLSVNVSRLDAAGETFLLEGSEMGMSNRSAMSEEEWEATRSIRVRLAYEELGVADWMRLTDAQRDEAVRAEVDGRNGAAYARACLRAAQ